MSKSNEENLTLNEQALRGNIRSCYWIRACLYSWVTIPTLLLFYDSQGLGISQLFYLKTLLSIVALILEIPSGYLADVVGRKKTAVLGCVFWLLCLLLYILGDGFYWFLAAELALGVAVSLLSGVDSALVYDSLLALKAEDQYKKIESKLGSINGFAEAIGGLTGALLASYDLRNPFYLQFVLVAAALLVTLTLKEPPRKKLSVSVRPWRGIMNAVSFALFQHRGVQSLILFYGVSACSTLLLVWLAQGYMKNIELSTTLFGVAWAVFHLFLGFGSLIAHRVDDFFGAFGTFLIMVIGTFIAFLMLGLWASPFGLLLIVLLYIIRGLRAPLFRFYINNHVESDVRATILSVQGFSVRFFAIIAAPSIGVLIDAYSLSTGFVVLSIVSFLLLSFSLYKIKVSNVLHLDEVTQ
ncbi:MAG: MFS transporter [Bdellovibrionales bacterium]|nr:MFS transporter [Bdellovibrionales bacterium]